MLQGEHDYALAGVLGATGLALPTISEVNEVVALGVGLCALALGLARLIYFFKEKWDEGRR